MRGTQPDPEAASVGAEGDSDDVARVTTREEFAALLEARRLASGKTLRQLAKAVDSGASTLSDWCSGKHLPFASQLETLARLLTELGVPGPEQASWLEAVVRVRQGSSRRKPAGPAPYLGLRSFGRDDRDRFFGRDALVAAAVEQLEEVAGSGDRPRMVVVVGASGSGKSSLLHAGLCAHLEEAGRSWVSMTPGAKPAERLLALLADVDAWCGETPAGPLVVVVDQFEELFTECTDDGERARFLALLQEHADPAREDHRTVVLGLRIDFYARAAGEDSLVRPLQDAQVLVGPPGPEELTSVIVEPARRTGCVVEDDLVGVLQREFAPGGVLAAGHDAGVLPLLSHALLETWRVAERDRMTVADYLRTGGLVGAIEQSAERVFQALTEPEQALARQLFLRLVHVDADGPPTRRALPHAEFEGLSVAATPGSGHAEALESAWTCVERFVEARLLTAHESSVQVTHEALLAAWPRLRLWVHEARDVRRLHQWLTDAADNWTERAHDPSLLARGGWLEELRALADDGASGTDGSHTVVLTQAERDFVTASVAAAEQADADLRRRNRRLRALASVAVLSAVLAWSLAVLAERARTDANLARDEALSRQLSVTADRLADRDLSLAAQLAIAAHRVAPTSEARSVLVDLAAEAVPTRYLGGAGPTALAVSPTGDLAAVSNATDGQVQLFSGSSGWSRAGVIDLPDRVEVYALALTPDESTLAVGDTTAAITLWDVSDPTSPRELAGPLRGPDGPIQQIDVSADGTELAVAGEGDGVFRWAVEEPSAPRELALVRAPGVTWSVAYSPDGRHLAFGDDDGHVNLWDISGQPVELARVAAGDRRAATVAFSPAGEHLAGGTVLGDLAVWDISTPATPQPVDVAMPRFASWVNTVAFSPDGRFFAAGSSDADLRVWHTATWEVAQHLPHPVNITQAAFDGTGALVTVAVDGTARRWDLETAVPHQMIGRVFSAGFDDAGSRLAVLSGEDVAVWDVTEDTDWSRLGPPVVELPGDPNSAGTGSISPDGTLLARGTIQDGELRLYDIAGTGAPRQVEVPQGQSARVLHAARFSADQQVLAAGGDDAQVRLWDLTDLQRPELAAVIDEPDGIVLHLSWSPAGRIMAVSSADSLVRLYDVDDPADPQPLAELDGFDSESYVAVFSPDGQTLAAAGTDGTVLRWDVTDPNTPTRIGPPIDGPVSRIFDLSFHPQGHLLAAVVTDGTIWLWDVADPDSARHIATLGPTPEPMYAASFTPSGDTLVGSGADGRVRAWRLDEAALQHGLCERIGDPITRHEWEIYLPHQPFDPPCG